MPDYEQALANSIFYNTGEKTFIEKILSRQDVQEVRELIKKPRLKREDLLELLYMLSSIESKLWNYSEWDRYIMAKYFVWIREFVAVCEQLFDYKEDLSKKEKQGKIKLSERTIKIFENNMRLMEHNIKFLVDLYFNLGRTTLSLGATGFLEILKNKYEIHYPTQALPTPEKQPAIQFKWKK